MVRKLKGFYYDKSKWKLERVDDREMYLVRLSNSKRRYYLGFAARITAITQVSKNLFIVLESYTLGIEGTNRVLTLYKIPSNGEIAKVSQVTYHRSCEFWTDTIVLLDEESLYDLSKGESIHKYYSLLSYLSKNNLSSIDLKRKDNREYLYCSKNIFSEYGRGDFLQLVIDVETCKPVLPVYSTLRDSLIDLTDTFTLKDLTNEELRYKSIVDDHMIGISMAAGEKLLLSAFED